MAYRIIPPFSAGKSAEWNVRADMGKLTDRGAKGKLAEGLHGDGGGLYLNVTGSGSRSWIFRSTVKGRTTATGSPYRVEVGLGAIADVGLSEAREASQVMRAQCRKGMNPLDEKRRERLTFEQVARALHTKEAPTWADSHAKRWLASLDSFVFPAIGSRYIEDIRRPDIVALLEPIWRTRHETARKVKIRLAQVIDYATDKGLYTEANPARGQLKSLDNHVHEPRHMPALPWQDLPAFIERLAERDSVSSRALEFSILTCARSGEVRGALWSEIDLAAGVWNLPKERMKARRAHRVPLSPEALAVLEKVRGLDTNLVFPSVQRAKDGTAKVMSDMAFKALFIRMKVEGITQHGFRSTFRDWASDSSRADRELSEAALAHVIGSKTERSYKRTDLFDRRKALMDAWAAYATGQTGQVVKLVRR